MVVDTAEVSLGGMAGLEVGKGYADLPVATLADLSLSIKLKKTKAKAWKYEFILDI
jgi:hypothetical protein